MSGTPIVDRSQRLTFSFRTIRNLVSLLIVCQGSMVGGSAFQLDQYGFSVGSLAPSEFFLIVLGVIVVMERTVTRDYSIRRSYFAAPIMLILSGLFISWSRGVIINQGFAIVYEAHEAFLLPWSLLIFANAFRDKEDRWDLLRVIIGGILFKSLEGLDIYLFSTSPNKEWGVVQSWRDGFLLGLGVVYTMLFLHFKPASLVKTRRLALIGFPVLIFTLLMSYRRTFIVGALVSAVLMIFTVVKRRRKRQVLILGGVLLGFVLFALATDPGGILARLSGIIEPSEEGSAYIRLLELPNVLQNIAHNPIFGTAIGTTWKTYYRMPTSAVYTTLGTHNTYLYYPLRAGILGTMGFLWLLLRFWKSGALSFRFARNEEDEFFAQVVIHTLIVYQVACFFGLMYGDAVSSLMGLILTMVQLQNESLLGAKNLWPIRLFDTWRERRLVVYDEPFWRPLFGRRAQDLTSTPAIAE